MVTKVGVQVGGTFILSSNVRDGELLCLRHVPAVLSMQAVAMVTVLRHFHRPSRSTDYHRASLFFFKTIHPTLSATYLCIPDII